MSTLFQVHIKCSQYNKYQNENLYITKSWVGMSLHFNQRKKVLKNPSHQLHFTFLVRLLTCTFGQRIYLEMFTANKFYTTKMCSDMVHGFHVVYHSFSYTTKNQNFLRRSSFISTESCNFWCNPKLSW